MRINADYHTHTRYSHGKGTPEQNVQRAIELGLARIAITDHGPAHLFYGIRGGGIRRLRREVDALNRRYSRDIEVLMGIEANLTGDGRADVPDPAVFDFMLIGYHKGAWPSGKEGRQFLKEALLGTKKDTRQRNTEALIRAMERYPVHAVSHPNTYIGVDMALLAEAAVSLGVALELSVRHRDLEEGMVRMAAERGAAFIISSDAHNPADVGRVQPVVDMVRHMGIGHRVANSSAYVHSTSMRFPF